MTKSTEKDVVRRVTVLRRINLRKVVDVDNKRIVNRGQSVNCKQGSEG